MLDWIVMNVIDMIPQILFIPNNMLPEFLLPG